MRKCIAAFFIGSGWRAEAKKSNKKNQGCNEISIMVYAVVSLVGRPGDGGSLQLCRCLYDK
jgi:hypothetical protein